VWCLIRGDDEAQEGLGKRPVISTPQSQEPKKSSVCLDQKTGQVRQAGSDAPGGFIIEAREQMQESLFYFAYGALGLTRLTQGLHLPVCEWLTTVPPYRKLLLLPRDHLKTSMMRALALHILLQEKGTNLYFNKNQGRRRGFCMRERRRLMRSISLGGWKVSLRRIAC
jgi:hypothetical protein